MPTVLDLLRKDDGLVCLTIIDTLAAVRQNLTSFQQNLLLDEVERAHLSNACTSLEAAIQRFSQRVIREAHQVAPDRVRDVAKEVGLEGTLQEATTAPVYFEASVGRKTH